MNRATVGSEGLGEIASARVETQSGCMQMKQGVLINSAFLATKWSVNYCTVSGTQHLNKYLITPKQNTRVWQEKSITIFWLMQMEFTLLLMREAPVEPLTTENHINTLFFDASVCVTLFDMKMWKQQQQQQET